MRVIARLSLVALDCPNPESLAAFYSAITGWPLAPVEEDDWLELVSDGGATIAFQRVADHQPPDWPTGARPQQLHLDFDVDDLDAAEAEIVALGAVKVAHQPKPHFWRVFLDPAGHPFCLVLAGDLRERLAAQGIAE